MPAEQARLIAEIAELERSAIFRRSNGQSSSGFVLQAQKAEKLTDVKRVELAAGRSRLDEPYGAVGFADKHGMTMRMAELIILGHGPSRGECDSVARVLKRPFE
jgi:hypothetical protein